MVVPSLVVTYGWWMLRTTCSVDTNTMHVVCTHRFSAQSPSKILIRQTYKSTTMQWMEVIVQNIPHSPKSKFSNLLRRRHQHPRFLPHALKIPSSMASKIGLSRGWSFLQVRFVINGQLDFWFSKDWNIALKGRVSSIHLHVFCLLEIFPRKKCDVTMLRAVLGPLVIDSIMGATFRRTVLLREGCDSGGSVVSCKSSCPQGGVPMCLVTQPSYPSHGHIWVRMLVWRRDVVSPFAGMCHIFVLSDMQLLTLTPIANFFQKS